MYFKSLIPDSLITEWVKITGNTVIWVDIINNNIKDAINE